LIDSCLHLHFIYSFTFHIAYTYTAINFSKLDTSLETLSIKYTFARWPIHIAAYCRIELLSWGYDDTPAKNGYARVNGRTVVNYNRPNQNELVRGFNFNLLRTSNCSTTESKHFDTYDSNSASADLAQYLGSLAPGTVLYGVTCDDATDALQTVARNALWDIGIDVGNLAHRGKLTFVATIGNRLLTQFQIASPGGDNLYMAALVPQTATDSTGSLLIRNHCVCTNYNSNVSFIHYLTFCSAS